jgi:alpha-glucosidase
MAQYTEAGRRLHMAYSFALLTPDHGAAHLRAEVEKLDQALAKTGGWGCWAVSNHDVPRVATRWSDGADGATPDPRATRLWLALLLSLRGSACLYQGEELGLPEADVPFELLQDPYGRAFWPAFKGRDGCRTPLPWQADAPQGGFSTATPWLPLAAAHRPLAVDRQAADPGSMLAYSRALLHWRRGQPLLRAGAMRFIDAPAPLLHIERRAGDAALQAVLNLSGAPQLLALPEPLVAVAGHPCDGGTLAAGARTLKLAPYGVFFGHLPS